MLRAMKRALIAVLIAGVAGCGPSPTVPEDADPAPGADRVLFAANDGARGRVIEQELASGRRTTLIEGASAVASPRYLPGGRFAFLRDTGGGMAVFVAARGKPPQRTTFHPGSDTGLAVTPSGRVLFQSSEVPGVLAMKWDGTGVWSYNERHEQPAPPARQLRWDRVGNGLLGLGERAWWVPAGDHYRTRVELAPSAVPPDRPLVPHAECHAEPTSVNPAAKTAELFCMDALAGLERAGQARVRVHLPAFGAASARTHEAPLAADGSFYLKLPPDRPLRLEVVAMGRTLSAMKSHIWLRPGEQRGCIGCHEPRGRAPGNRLIQALERPAVEVTP